ncbi:MAG: hypothetical protein CMK09_11060 [Ponticaulis sp.]|nr:hypothetical protein [Ponticaulis sp.]|tara:strand:- start:47206 stop:47994 length:789 start_codon:yes stop_codon:yes gene_type:complete
MLINELRYTALPTAPASPPAQAAPVNAPTTSRSTDPVDRVELSSAAQLSLSSETAIATSANGTTQTEECAECAAGICTSCGDKAAKKTDETELSEEEQAQVKELKERDDEVRAHEAAHAAVGGAYAGSPSYDYQTGPDGNRYAIGGEVKIDTAPIEGDPQATIDKMRQVQAAALAPAEPSGQDRKVAAAAAAKMREAEAELAAQRSEELKEQSGKPDTQQGEGVGLTEEPSDITSSPTPELAAYSMYAQQAVGSYEKTAAMA